MMKTYSEIQDRVKDRMGKDVHLLSISVDPTNDTPEKLKEFAKSFDAMEGWYFLTGDKANVDHALTKLGLFAEKRESHSNVFLMGNGKSGLWKKAMGLADSADVIKVFDTVLDDGGN